MLLPAWWRRSTMSKAEEFRNYAAKCLRQSEQATDQDKAVWLSIAKEWLRVAEAAERNPRAFAP